MPNFGEAHNDHLQVLAGTGLVGYGFMLAAIALLASRSFIRRADDDDERARFARLASLPLAIGFSVSALAQFPLELAAALTAYLFYSALCVAWSTESTSV
jgi:O-antigen ligase